MKAVLGLLFGFNNLRWSMLAVFGLERLCSGPVVQQVCTIKTLDMHALGISPIRNLKPSMTLFFGDSQESDLWDRQSKDTCLALAVVA
jgi:hypothetical protein